MLKKLLPKELWKTKIKYKDWRTNMAGHCFYDAINDFIVFNRKRLISNSYLTTKKAIYKYEHLIKTKKDYLIFCLLHELGHRYFKDIEEMKQCQQVGKNIYNSSLSKIEAHFKYWELLSEKKAMLFAKHFFKLYKEKQNETQKI